MAADIVVRLLLSINRERSLEEAMETVALAASLCAEDRGVVGEPAPAQGGVRGPLPLAALPWAHAGGGCWSWRLLRAAAQPCCQP